VSSDASPIFTAGEALDGPTGLETAPPIFTFSADDGELESEWAETAWNLAPAPPGTAEPWSTEYGAVLEEAEGPETAEWEAAQQLLGHLPGQSFLTPTGSAVPMTFPSGLVLQQTTGATGVDQEHWDPAGVNLPLYATGAQVRDQKVSANFTVGELVRSGTHLADVARISVDLVRCLQAIRDRVGTGVGINSGYRSWHYNVALYKSRNQTPTKSRHCSGQAADISIPGMVGMDIAKMAIEIYGDGIGVGIANSYAHVDVRGSWSSWTYLSGADATRAISEINAFRDKWKASGAKPTIGTPQPVVGGGPSWIPSPTAPTAVPVTARPPASGPTQPRTTTFLNSAWARYACAEKDMVPVHLLSNRTAVNPLTVDAWAALARALLSTGYQAKSTWCYICRLIAGSTQRSLHSFGIALDIDPDWNPHLLNTVGAVRFSTQQTQAGRIADILAKRAETVFTPAQIAAVEAIRTIDGLQVFNWGGRWKTSHDSMHFQIDLTPDELRRGIDARTVPAAGAREFEGQWQEAASCQESLDEL
jgi:hypothetical protein